MNMSHMKRDNRKETERSTAENLDADELSGAKYTLVEDVSRETTAKSDCA